MSFSSMGVMFVLLVNMSLSSLVMRLVTYVFLSPQIVIYSCHSVCLLACYYKKGSCVGRCQNWLLGDFPVQPILFIIPIMSC